MPRAHRIFIPGHIWHITHRCHAKAFLLDDTYERRTWLIRLREAVQRYRLTVLGYCVTCNHVHLLLQDAGPARSIARGMQYVQGRTAQSYNERHARINAFWGDRYHATAVQSGAHLFRCLAYIDLNMVRAGAVADPADWHECGYREIQTHNIKNKIIDTSRLAHAVGCSDRDSLRRMHRALLDDALKLERCARDGRWSESVAVGSSSFVTGFAEALGDSIGNRAIIPSEETESYVLRETVGVRYGDLNADRTDFLGGDNEVPFDSAIEEK